MITLIEMFEKNHLHFDNLNQRLDHLCRNLAVNPAHHLSSLTARLHSLSTRHTLERGYTILRDVVDGHVISNAAAAQHGQTLEAELAHGWLQCTVDGVSTRSRHPTERSHALRKTTTHSKRN